jgi:hypothetical protein
MKTNMKTEENATVLFAAPSRKNNSTAAGGRGSPGNYETLAFAAVATSDPVIRQDDNKNKRTTADFGNSNKYHLKPDFDTSTSTAADIDMMMLDATAYYQIPHAPLYATTGCSYRIDNVTDTTWLSQQVSPNRESTTKIPSPVYLFGVRKDGVVAAVQVNGFRRYFLVEVPAAAVSDPSAWTAQLSRLFRQQAGCENSHTTIAVQIDRQPKRPYYGYQNAPMYVARVECSSFGVHRQLIERLDGYQYKKKHDDNNDDDDDDDEIERVLHQHTFRVHEADKMFNPLLQFFDKTGIAPGSWFRLPARRYQREPGPQRTHASLELIIHINDLQPVPSCNEIPALLVASVDIEVYNSRGGDTFPDANIEGDKIMMIATRFVRHGSNAKPLDVVYRLSKQHPSNAAM